MLRSRQALYIGASVMSVRAKCFKKNEAFSGSKAVQQMAEEHKKAFGSPMNDLGYPDMGSGRYSALLEYPLWVEFNNAQRAHYNMVESVGPVIGALLSSGLATPRVAAGLGVGYAFGRLLYAKGYTSSKGADGRMAGAGMAALCTLGLYGLAIVNGLRAALI